MRPAGCSTLTAKKTKESAETFDTKGKIIKLPFHNQRLLMVQNEQK